MKFLVDEVGKGGGKFMGPCREGGGNKRRRSCGACEMDISFHLS